MQICVGAMAHYVLSEELACGSGTEMHRLIESRNTKYTRVRAMTEFIVTPMDLLIAMTTRGYVS